MCAKRYVFNSEIILMPATLQLEIASDIVCPWCYIGKRRLEKALALFAANYPDQSAPRVSWLPFQLNPDLPPEGMRRDDYLQRKFGSADGGGMYERVSAEGRKESLDFDFSAITRQPNTLRAHALLAAALKSDESGALQAKLKEALMKAYFCEGADLTQEAVLLRIAANAGMPLDAANFALHDTAVHQDIAAQDAELRRIGISGVPFFIINRSISVAGAQPSDALLVAFEQALNKSAYIT